MNLNQTPSANRIQIGLFGLRNVGKSSLINSLTNQSLSIVADYKGTTTDPVRKALELFPIGPVVLIDTPGLDDYGTLGQLRVEKAYQVLSTVDVALLIVDHPTHLKKEEEAILKQIKQRQIPFLIVRNKCDQFIEKTKLKNYELAVSSQTGKNLEELKQHLGRLKLRAKPTTPIIKDLIVPQDVVVLVTPQDGSAPKGRLILPQQQTIREIIDQHGIVITCQPDELQPVLLKLSQAPKLVVTDSQVFNQVAIQVPKNILLTSFSILFARHKGILADCVQGAKTLDQLNEGDKILICEGCTHHRQCEDIGTVKLPKWIQQYTKKNINFEFTSGADFPENLNSYKLIIHCGGCMLNENSVRYRLKKAQEKHIPITNYGISIAFMNQILPRTLEPFRELDWLSV